MGSLFARALFAFLALPGMVAYLIPLALIGKRAEPWATPGLVIAAVGTGVLLWCVRDFYVAGRGTLAPWSPPINLVRVGLYRYSRNPMYLGVITILLGWAAMFQSRPHLIYAGFVALVFHLRVVFFEEPWLADRHGAEWDRYRSAVPRWLL